ncbi:MAG TPA: hypothetical protein VHM26_08045 [Chitinophagaceae bacterium]|nr:hypothetical protein [Chitinophagaceae bacterium]
MKITAIIIVLSMLLVTITSCQKDKTEEPFSATGYWNGGVNQINAFIYNNANGTARFYAYVTGYDTSKATMKMAGSYTVNNGLYYAKFWHITGGVGDTSRFEATTASAGTMTGKFMLNGAHFISTFTKVP